MAQRNEADALPPDSHPPLKDGSFKLGSESMKYLHSQDSLTIGLVNDGTTFLLLAGRRDDPHQTGFHPGPSEPSTVARNFSLVILVER